MRRIIFGTFAIEAVGALILSIRFWTSGYGFIKGLWFGAFHSILDGSLVKHEEGSAYYTVFTQALSLPIKIARKLRIKNGGLIRTLTHIKNAAPELMTGGPLDNNNYYIEF